MLVSVGMMLVSIYTLALSTDRSFQRPLTNCERLQIMHESNMEGIDLIRDVLKEYCDEPGVPENTSIHNETDREGNMFVVVTLDEELDDWSAQRCPNFSVPFISPTPPSQIRTPPEPPMPTSSPSVTIHDPPVPTISASVTTVKPLLTTINFTIISPKSPDPKPTHQPISNDTVKDLRNNRFSPSHSMSGDNSTSDSISNDTSHSLDKTSNTTTKPSHTSMPVERSPEGEGVLCGALPPPTGPTVKRIRIPNLEIPLDIFSIVELILLVYFTLDLALRLTACPCISRYFTSVVNVTDAMALLGAYVHYAVLIFLPREQHDDTWVVVVQMLQMFRSFRLFRVVVGFSISKVLAYSLVQNLKDLLIMCVYLFAGMCIFSTVLYIVEKEDTIDSIPSGMYWAVVTMTTVGYGDIVPQSKTGRFIGGVCAVSGVMMFALVIPLVVNQFITLYQYVGLEELGDQNKGDNPEEDGNGKCGDNPWATDASVEMGTSRSRDINGLNIV